METFTRFLYEFLAQFFSGIGEIFKGLWGGITQIFNFGAYKDILGHYSEDFSIPEWILVIIAIVLLVGVVALVIFLLYLLLRKYLKFRKAAIEQDELLEEVANLNRKVADLMKEKDEILAMKVSQLGLKPGESPELEGNEEQQDEAGEGIRIAPAFFTYRNILIDGFAGYFSGSNLLKKSIVLCIIKESRLLQGTI